jgi:hypothetical protein
MQCRSDFRNLEASRPSAHVHAADERGASTGSTPYSRRPAACRAWTGRYGMTTAIEAIREELATLRLHINRLERAETVLDPTQEPIEPPSFVTPRSSTTLTPPRGPRRRNPTRVQLREYIVEHAPITRRELLVALGGTPQAMDNKLARLLADGEIGADGRPGARRYRSPDTSEGTVAPSITSSTTPTPQTPPEQGVYPLYDAIVELNGATTEQLMRQTGLPTNLIVEQGRRLMQLGLVRFTGVGDGRMWLPTPVAVGDAA